MIAARTVRRPGRRHHPLLAALTVALLACLFVLPVLRSVGELHHAVAHAESSERHVHSAAGHAGDAHAHAQSAPAATEADAATALHALMHLPAAAADMVALLHAAISPALPETRAEQRSPLRDDASPSTAAALPYRPPISG